VFTDEVEQGQGGFRHEEISPGFVVQSEAEAS